MKEKILTCKQEHPDWGYQKIADFVGCSKNTVKYHLSPEAKSQNYKRTKNNRKNISGILHRKHDNFNCIGDWRKYQNTRGRNRMPSKFSIQELQQKLISNSSCYLTGRKINLLEPKTYQLDHQHPIAKGGDNSLSNCQLACKDANIAKHDMLLEDFLALCQEILEHHGYKISK